MKQKETPAAITAGYLRSFLRLHDVPDGVQLVFRAPRALIRNEGINQGVITECSLGAAGTLILDVDGPRHEPSPSR